MMLLQILGYGFDYFFLPAVNMRGVFWSLGTRRSGRAQVV
jgi:hypothetical protein